MKHRVKPHLLFVRHSLISAGPVFTGVETLFIKERKRLESKFK